MKTTKEIIRMRYGKSFSPKGQWLFARWFRAEGDEKEKENTLQQLWDEDKTMPSSQTEHEWERLKQRMDITERESEVKSPKFTLHRDWMRYAAMLILAIASAVTALVLKEQLSPTQVSMNQHFVPYGNMQKQILADGTKVWLNSGSLLVAPTNFDALDCRKVYLTGQAYFEVAKNKKKPFIVQTRQMEVKALGTSFTVDAYDTEHTVKATLEEGSIEINLNQYPNQPHLLTPGQQLIYNNDTYQVEVVQIDHSLCQMEREGYIVLRNASLDELVQTLERKYNVMIQFNSSHYQGDLLNVKLAPHETLEGALEVLNLLMGINYHVKGDTVYLK